MKSFQTRTTIVLLSLFCTAFASCSPNLPFSNAIVNTTVLIRRPCGPARFVSYSSVTITASEITYFPFSSDFNHGLSPGWVCPPRYIFKVHKWAPALIEMPRLVLERTQRPTREECQHLQQRQRNVSFPVGPTRDRYINGMNKTLSGIKYLRDNECRSEGRFPFRYTEEFLNPKLDGVITYLLGVAFNFHLCLGAEH